MDEGATAGEGSNLPIMRMYWPEVDRIVSHWQWNGRTGTSLLVILRGVPGSGKSSFAMFLKIAAEAKQMRAVICSADDYFRSPAGYRFHGPDLGLAHDYCYDMAVGALSRRVDFVIIDNTNLKPEHWEPYEKLTFRQSRVFGPKHFLHGLCRVNFTCGSPQVALELADRTGKDIAQDTVLKYQRWHKDNSQAFGADITVTPIMNSWDQELGPPRHPWDDVERGAPLQWL